MVKIPNRHIKGYIMFCMLNTLFFRKHKYFSVVTTWFHLKSDKYLAVVNFVFWHMILSGVIVSCVYSTRILLISTVECKQPTLWPIFEEQ